MEEYTEDGILGWDGGILRLAMLAPFGCAQGRQDDYHRIIDLEVYTENGRQGDAGAWQREKGLRRRDGAV